MRPKAIAVNVALLIMVGGLGLMRFSDGVRTVQVLGLFGSGMAVGVALISIMNALRAKSKTE